MLGSYGSYGSMSAAQITAPIDIGNMRSSPVCAFPSWPRRSHLDDDHSYSSSSYLSDEDLFLGDDSDDSASATSSASSRSNSNASSISPPVDWRQAQQPFALPPQDQFQQQQPSEDEMLEIQRERQAYQRELVRAVLKEKEHRRMAASAAKRQRRAAAAMSSTSTSSRKKSAKLAVIAEDI